MSSNTSTTRPRATKAFKALIAAGFDDAEALNVLGVQAEPEVDPRIATLVAGGFTAEQAEAIIAGKDGAKGGNKGKGKKGKKAKAEPEAEAAPELTNKQIAEALVASQGLAFTRGRVYGGVNLAEAIVTVHRTGEPTIVPASGAGRVAAVLVYREASGDVAQQNLMKPV